MLIVIIPKPII